ncbi:MAG: hypothetical protein HY558_03280 [Euryarchaeota archaeon]|nr:hypothetical protein [Euryarchaeota archaeon]
MRTRSWPAVDRAILAGVLLLVLASVAGGQSASLTLTGYTLTPEVPMPGDTVTLKATLKNPNTSTVNINNIYFSAPGIDVSNSFYSSPGSLGAGDSAPFSFVFKAPSSDGLYPTEVQAATSAGGSARFPIPVRVDSRGLDILLEETPPLIPPEGAQLRVTVANPRPSGVTGVRLASQAPGVRFSPAEVYIGNLAAGNSSAVSLTAYAAEEGSRVLRFAAVFNNGDNPHRSETTAAASTESRPSMEVSVSNETRTIAQGESDLVFLADNRGASPLLNLQLSWEDPQGKIVPIGTSSRAFVERVERGRTASFPFRVSAASDLAQGVHSLNVTLLYTDSAGVQKTRSLRLGVFVGGTTQFDVALQDAGGGVLSLSIANTGLNPATSLVVRLPPQAGLQPRGSSSVALGNLNAGDYTTATFQATALSASTPETPEHTGGRGGRPGATGALRVELEYTDTTGARRTLPKEVQFNPAALAGAMGGPRGQSSREPPVNPLYPLAAIAAIGGLLLYKRRAIASRLRPPKPPSL